MEMSGTVDLGSVAPDFTLVDMNMKQRNLAEFRGRKAVLAFCPGAFTSVCQKRGIHHLGLDNCLGAPSPGIEAFIRRTIIPPGEL